MENWRGFLNKAHIVARGLQPQECYYKETIALVGYMLTVKTLAVAAFIEEEVAHNIGVVQDLQCGRV